MKCQYFNDSKTDFTKIDNFIENRQIFMLLNCNCAKLPNFEFFKTCLGRPFFHGHSVVVVYYYYYHFTAIIQDNLY